MRAGRVAGGAVLLVIGIVLLILPGPGLPLLAGGLLLLEPEFHWAGRARRAVMSAVTRAKNPARAITRWMTQRAAYGLALLPVLTDWLDTGHWPQHPRELATEIVLGALILFGVYRLHRRAETYRSEAETDALTGLPNRRRFRADLEQAASGTRSSERMHLAKRAPGDGASDSLTFGRLNLVTVAPKTAERRAPHAWKMSHG